MSVAKLLTLRRLLVLFAAYLSGSIPFSNLFAGRVSGVDLRRFGSGTVSGTSLYQVAGFRVLAVSGLLDIAKGASAAAAARALGRPQPPPQATRWRSPSPLEAMAAGLVVSGHNWSPFLEGAGGRGIAPSVGAYLVVAPEGAAVLMSGLTAGRLIRQSGLGTFIGQVALVPVLGYTRGRRGALAGAAVLAPMIAKRLLGNGPSATGDRRVYLTRLFFDRDHPGGEHPSGGVE